MLKLYPDSWLHASFALPFLKKICSTSSLGRLGRFCFRFSPWRKNLSRISDGLGICPVICSRIWCVEKIESSPHSQRLRPSTPWQGSFSLPSEIKRWRRIAVRWWTHITSPSNHYHWSLPWAVSAWMMTDTLLNKLLCFRCSYPGRVTADRLQHRHHAEQTPVHHYWLPMRRTSY
jgi:hypothetical protein